jgi:hypothetical protein
MLEPVVFVQPDVWAECLSQASSSSQQNSSTNTTELILCISDLLSAKVLGSYDYTRSILLLLSAAMVFFMQAGFAMVRMKHINRPIYIIHANE